MIELTFHSIYVVDKDPISPEEGKRSVELVEEYLITNNDPIPYHIPWKDLQLKVKTECGKFRSRNSLKNVWCSNKRRTERLAKEVKRNEDKIEDVTEKMN